MSEQKIQFANNYSLSYLNEKYLNWNATAIDCYNRKFKCDGCIMNNLECKCMMKNTVLKIYALRGKPPKPEPIPDVEEIWSYIDKGMHLKDIAKIYGLTVAQFAEITKAYCINGRLLQGGEMAKRYKRRG